eukprot:320762-Prymnesium_polylepis.1
MRGMSKRRCARDGATWRTHGGGAGEREAAERRRPGAYMHGGRRQARGAVSRSSGAAVRSSGVVGRQ